MTTICLPLEWIGTQDQFAESSFYDGVSVLLPFLQKRPYALDLFFYLSGLDFSHLLREPKTLREILTQGLFECPQVAGEVSPDEVIIGHGYH